MPKKTEKTMTLCELQEFLEGEIKIAKDATDRGCYESNGEPSLTPRASTSSGFAGYAERLLSEVSRYAIDPGQEVGPEATGRRRSLHRALNRERHRLERVWEAMIEVMRETEVGMRADRERHFAQRRLEIERARKLSTK